MDTLTLTAPTVQVQTETKIRRSGKCPGCHQHATFTFKAVQFWDDEETRPVCELWNCNKCGSSRAAKNILWSRVYPPVSCPTCGMLLDGLYCLRCEWQVYRLHNGAYVETPAPASRDATAGRLDNELASGPVERRLAELEAERATVEQVNVLVPA